MQLSHSSFLIGKQVFKKNPSVLKSSRKFLIHTCVLSTLYKRDATAVLIFGIPKVLIENNNNQLFVYFIEGWGNNAQGAFHFNLLKRISKLLAEFISVSHILLLENKSSYITLHYPGIQILGNGAMTFLVALVI